jgi:MFS family permease
MVMSYLYSKLPETGVSPHIGTGGSLFALGLAFSLTQLSNSLGWIAAAGLMIYVGSFAVGLGPAFWLILSEIYPLRIRGRAMSVGTAANWITNLIVALSFLTLTQILGKPATFWLYGAVSVGAWSLRFSLCRRPRERAWRKSKPAGGPRRIRWRHEAEVTLPATARLRHSLSIIAAASLALELAAQRWRARSAGPVGSKTCII